LARDASPAGINPNGIIIPLYDNSYRISPPPPSFSAAPGIDEHLKGTRWRWLNVSMSLSRRAAQYTAIDTQIQQK